MLKYSNMAALWANETDTASKKKKSNEIVEKKEEEKGKSSRAGWKWLDSEEKLLIFSQLIRSENGEIRALESGLVPPSVWDLERPWNVKHGAKWTALALRMRLELIEGTIAWFFLFFFFCSSRINSCEKESRT